MRGQQRAKGPPPVARAEARNKRRASVAGAARARCVAHARRRYWPGTQSRPLRCAGPGSPGSAPAAARAARRGGCSPLGAGRRASPGAGASAAARRSARTPAAAATGRRGSARPARARPARAAAAAPGRLDRQPDLLGIALVLGARRQPGAAHPEVDQRHDVLEQHVLDADPLDLRLVGGSQLLLGRLPPLRWLGVLIGSPPRASGTPAYVSRVSATVAA